MKKAVAVLVALVIAALILPPAQASAGSSTDAALALGAFAVFNQILAGQTIFQQGPRYVVHEPVVVYQPPPVVYQPPPPVAYAPPPAVIYAPPPPPVFVYPNGYYAYAAPYPYGPAGYYRQGYYRQGYYKHWKHRDDDD
jgi:hypothetical protein